MRKAVIISTPDSYANGVKPKHLKSFLERRGFRVEILQGAHRTSMRGILDNLSISNRKLNYLWNVFAMTATKLLPTGRLHRWAASRVKMMRFDMYGQITHKRLKLMSPDLIICESNVDIGFVLLDRVADVQILDLPCPLAEELYYGNSIDEVSYEKYKALEVAAYEKADALSFHWHTYADYVKKTKYNGDNFIDMGYGTDIKGKTATYSKRPQVIFLGLLKGYWVNLPLLEALCEVYPNIDVYGGPKPPDGSRINYKGYAPSLDVMAEYQFGLTTITGDELRKNSFSSKHLEYISYGLPVFTPSWRKDRKLDDSSIYYDDVDDFVRQLQLYSSEPEWQKKHEAALSTANQTSWDRAFEALGELVDRKGLA